MGLLRRGLPRRLSKKVAEAEEAVLGKREADNVIADLRRQLGSAQEEIATLQVRCAALLPRLGQITARPGAPPA